MCVYVSMCVCVHACVSVRSCVCPCLCVHVYFMYVMLLTNVISVEAIADRQIDKCTVHGSLLYIDIYRQINNTTVVSDGYILTQHRTLSSEAVYY